MSGPEVTPQPDRDDNPLVFDLSGGDFPGLMEIVHKIRTDAAACEDPTESSSAEIEPE